MNTINLSLSITAALSLLRNVTVADNIRDEIENAIASSFGKGYSPTSRYLDLTVSSVIPRNKIKCIAAVRNALRWGLKESNDFIKAVLGVPDYTDGYDTEKYMGGTANTLTGPADAVESLAKELSELGCVVSIVNSEKLSHNTMVEHHTYYQ